MKLRLFPFILLSVMVGCTNKNAEEEQHGYAVLADARRALQARNFKEARARIVFLRNTYPYAFNAREEAIIVLDSVDLLEAQETFTRVQRIMDIGNLTPMEQDTLRYSYDEAAQKIRFYTHKLEHDKRNMQKHE